MLTRLEVKDLLCLADGLECTLRHAWLVGQTVLLSLTSDFYLKMSNIPNETHKVE